MFNFVILFVDFSIASIFFHNVFAIITRYSLGVMDIYRQRRKKFQCFFFVVLTWSVALTWSSKCNTHKKSLPIKCPNQFDSALSAMVFSIQSKRRVAISIIMKDAATIGAFRYFNTISVDSVSTLALFIQLQKICQNCGSGAIFAGNISF